MLLGMQLAFHEVQCIFFAVINAENGAAGKRFSAGPFDVRFGGKCICFSHVIDMKNGLNQGDQIWRIFAHSVLFNYV
jgi:hypothetical protein